MEDGKCCCSANVESASPSRLSTFVVFSASVVSAFVASSAAASAGTSSSADDIDDMSATFNL